MSRNGKKNGTALATVDAAPPARQITRSEANARIKSRALELYHEARARREDEIRAFESEYGRIDRIDQTVLADLQRIQARLAAISARQQRTSATNGEPKVSKQVEMLGQLVVGSISAYLATERALELLAPIQQADYVGWNSGVGPKGQDESVLAGYEIIDDPLGPKNVTPTAGEDGEVCLHEEIEPFEDEPTHGACVACGEEFELNDTAAEPESEHDPSDAVGDEVPA